MFAGFSMELAGRAGARAVDKIGYGGVRATPHLSTEAILTREDFAIEEERMGATEGVRKDGVLGLEGRYFDIQGLAIGGGVHQLRPPSVMPNSTCKSRSRTSTSSVIPARSRSSRIVSSSKKASQPPRLYSSDSSGVSVRVILAHLQHLPAARDLRRTAMHVVQDVAAIANPHSPSTTKPS